MSRPPKDSKHTIVTQSGRRLNVFSDPMGVVMWKQLITYGGALVVALAGLAAWALANHGHPDIASSVSIATKASDDARREVKADLERETSAIHAETHELRERVYQTQTESHDQNQKLDFLIRQSVDRYPRNLRAAESRPAPAPPMPVVVPVPVVIQQKHGDGGT